MSSQEKSIKLIALDMDGTLLNHKHQVSEANQWAIEQAKQKDVHVMLSTGRRFETCYSYAEQLELNTYLITVNGGQIWSPDQELIEQHLLDDETIEALWNIGVDAGMHMWLVSTNDIFHEDKGPEDFSKHDWLKIGFHSQDEDRLRYVKESLSSYRHLEVTNSQPTNIEVNPFGVNKANGIKRVCKELDISMKEVMAVGDSLNDIRMIEKAGIGVAMGNAQAPVKEVADFLTDTNENDGVAKSIEQFVL